MKRYSVERIRHGEDIAYVTLRPKRPRDKLRFAPGQYAAIGFKNGRRYSPMRCFSIVSSPARPDKLQFAMRVKGDFTRSFSKLETGAEVMVQGPFGEFVIDEHNDDRVVLLAGGIGVTPFMSMIRTACYTNSKLPITVLHSYRSGHNIPFHDELQSLAEQNSSLKVYTFVTDRATAPESPRLLSGKMSRQHINHVTSGDYFGSTYFICGPKGFMDSAITMLKANGVSDDQIVTESFTQSSKVMTKQGYNVQKLTYSLASAVLLVGVGSIAYLDLSRYVPRYAQAASKVQASVKPAVVKSTGIAPPTTSTAPAAASSPDTTSSTSNNTYSQPVQTYQPPVTSVS